MSVKNVVKFGETGVNPVYDENRHQIKANDEFIICKITFNEHKKFERICYIDGFTIDGETPVMYYTTSKVLCETADKIIEKIGINRDGELKQAIQVKVIGRKSDNKNNYLTFE